MSLQWLQIRAGLCPGSNPLCSIVIIPILAPLLLQYNDYWTVCYLLCSDFYIHQSQLGRSHNNIFFLFKSQLHQTWTFSWYHVFGLDNLIKILYAGIIITDKKIKPTTVLRRYNVALRTVVTRILFDTFIIFPFQLNLEKILINLVFVLRVLKVVYNVRKVVF